jgi:sugar porter (SP) family MFS transporter
MMNMINTNRSYLQTMELDAKSPIVGLIVSVYYIGCAIGAAAASQYANTWGRKPSILGCVLIASVGNLLMFTCGLGYVNGTLLVMLLGRCIMGFGVGGVSSVAPVYASELAPDSKDGKTVTQRLQMNTLGLNVAFAVNLVTTHELGKDSQWAWRVPIIIMLFFPLILFFTLSNLPETPYWLMSLNKPDDAHKALTAVHGPADAQAHLERVIATQIRDLETPVRFADLLLPRGLQFHPTIVSSMAQINQALTGYAAVAVYGPQMFQLLGLAPKKSEFVTQADFVLFFASMTLAWLLVDRIGRRSLMVWGAAGLTISYAALTGLGRVASDTIHTPQIQMANVPIAVSGVVVLFLATSILGIGWLATAWLIPTEVYPSAARVQGTAISVVVWGLANFGVTFLVPILFNNLQYGLFAIFAASNAFAGLWTWVRFFFFSLSEIV